ncbi:MAG TPA: Mov34/MPN/PAD-1 family protein, partial [Ignavibacteria bacterium]
RQDTIDKNEAGGILLGQINRDCILITRASVPNKKEKSDRYNFVRNKTKAQIIIDYEFVNSGSKTIYLGEWHTHPFNIANPSRVDIEMIKEQFKNNIIQTDFLMLVILGIKKDYIGIYNGKKLNTIYNDKL